MRNSIVCRRGSEPSQQQKEKNKIEYRLLGDSNQLISIGDLKNIIESGNQIKNLIPENKVCLLKITAINEFWQTLNDPTKTQKIRDFALKELCKKGYKVAKFIDDEQTVSIEYDQVNCHIKEAGQFDGNYKLISGSKEHIETGNIEDCKVCLTHIYRIGGRKILTLQSFKSPTTGKEVVFRGSFDETHPDGKATLLNGVIEYKQQENYTKINVKDGKIVSMLDYFQKDGVTIQSYFNFENTQESFVEYYQQERNHKVNIKEVAEKFSKQIPDCLSIKAENLNCIDTFRENCIQEVQKICTKTQISRRKSKKQKKTTTKEEDVRDIDGLVQFIDSEYFLKNALEARKKQSSTASSSNEPPQNTSSTIEDHDADDIVREFYEQQQKLRQQFDTKEKRTPQETIKISQFATNLTRAVLPEMAYAPSRYSDTTTASSQASSSGLEQTATPSTTCSLPKKANFYGIFEVSLLSEILQAVTFILKEDSPEHATRDEQTKEYYYNLLNNITNTSNVNGISLEYLCEGLELTSEQTEKLTMKILKRAKDNYDLQMNEFAHFSALQKAYELAERKWHSGEALKEQQQDLQQNFSR